MYPEDIVLDGDDEDDDEVDDNDECYTEREVTCETKVGVVGEKKRGRRPKLLKKENLYEDEDVDVETMVSPTRLVTAFVMLLLLYWL